ncbi:MAG: hypothetical protein LBI71_11280 [Enterobacteriaceae bacterium]|jgi:hypothetical protein|nr:hypothetical protein [Enterobacteriaceae bacterium]
MKLLNLQFNFFIFISLGSISIASNAETSVDTDKKTIADKLYLRFSDTQTNCGDEGVPALLCSGILIRGTVASDSYHSWNPSPTAQKLGAVSFSYLRSDIEANMLASFHHNGFIFFPYMQTLNDNSAQKYPQILCYFPLDGNTESRSEKGCGSDSRFPTASQPCENQGITTSDQWVAQFYNETKDSDDVWTNDFAQCSFNLVGQGSATRFAEAIKVHYKMSLNPDMKNLYDQRNNEVLLAVWDQNIPTKLPLEAFFYQKDGLADAQHDQNDYYQVTGKILPIVQFIFSNTSYGHIQFKYNESDQLKLN